MLRHVVIRFDSSEEKFLVIASHVELGVRSWTEFVSAHDDRDEALISAEKARNLHGAYGAEIVFT